MDLFDNITWEESWMRTTICISGISLFLGGETEAIGVLNRAMWADLHLKDHSACCHGNILLTIFVPLLCSFLWDFCLTSPSWKFTFLIKSFRFSFVSGGHPFLLTPPLNSLGKEENTAQRELSPLNFYHLNSLRWQGPVAESHCFFLVQTEDFPELCPRRD